MSCEYSGLDVECCPELHGEMKSSQKQNNKPCECHLSFFLPNNSSFPDSFFYMLDTVLQENKWTFIGTGICLSVAVDKYCYNKTKHVEHGK